MLFGFFGIYILFFYNLGKVIGKFIYFYIMFVLFNFIFCILFFRRFFIVDLDKLIDV